MLVQQPPYYPLEEILCYDDFDNGLNGWVNLTPNLQQNSFDYFPAGEKFTDWGPPMLSSATFSLVGTHGSRNGTYSMKIGSKPVAGPADEQPIKGSMGHALKRLTFMERKLLKCEMWYTFKAEQDRPGIGENDVRAFGFLWDIQDDQNRYFCGARYLNSANGKLQQRWQIVHAENLKEEDWGDMVQSAPGEDPDSSSEKNFVFLKPGVDPQWLGKRYKNGDSDSFMNVPDSYQKLCYNETADKINWHYFSLTVDLEKREYVEMQSVNRKFNLRGIKPTIVDGYPRINFLVNPILWIEADTDRRVFLYVDSVVNSMGKSK